MDHSLREWNFYVVLAEGLEYLKSEVAFNCFYAKHLMGVEEERKVQRRIPKFLKSDEWRWIFQYVGILVGHI
jgi:hypothetical protein